MSLNHAAPHRGAKKSAGDSSQQNYTTPVQTAAVPAGSKLSFTIHEACEATGIGRSTLYEQLQAGRLGKIKVGRRTLITAGELQRWLASFETTGPVGA